jgi:hypothetical protein
MQFRVAGKVRNGSDQSAADAKSSSRLMMTGKVISARQQTIGDGNLAAGATGDFTIAFVARGNTGPL